MLLVDHSGSMHSGCEGGLHANLTKHEAVRSALHELAGTLRDDDRVALWEFDTACDPVGSGQPVGPSEFGLLVPHLSGPAGGTEIGGALDRVRSVEARDVLLITDGKSYALDVQGQALAGRRIFVVLVGEDSLEARVGHLAALTGGDLQFSFGADVGRALAACVQGMRLRRVANSAGEFDADGSPLRVRTARGGASIEAHWTARSGDGEAEPFSAAVAAYAASLAVACASQDHATGIAVREGLVTHLTSLFLRVDDGERQEGLPLARRVGLPTPRTERWHGVSYSRAPAGIRPQSPERVGATPLGSGMPEPVEDLQVAIRRQIDELTRLRETADDPTTYDAPIASLRAQLERPRDHRVDVAAIAGVIDWDVAADALAQGDLRDLPDAVADAIMVLSVHEKLITAAAGSGSTVCSWPSRSSPRRPPVDPAKRLGCAVAS